MRSGPSLRGSLVCEAILNKVYTRNPLPFGGLNHIFDERCVFAPESLHCSFVKSVEKRIYWMQLVIRLDFWGRNNRDVGGLTARAELPVLHRLHRSIKSPDLAEEV